jgi:ubiquinone/menaquinone biosynthesis C-methylase UbiE
MGLAQLSERPEVFALMQRLNPFTVSRIRELAVRNVPNAPGLAILDIGCGVGYYRGVFNETAYTGVDVNPAYIEFAQRTHRDAEFRIMSAEKLDFPDKQFNAALSTGMTHHLSDDVLSAMVKESRRVTKERGTLHIVDAILPVSRRARLKRWFFLQDVGRHQRSVGDMTDILSANANLTRVEVLTGPLHDVAYFRLQF